MKTGTDEEFIAMRVFIADWLKRRRAAYVHLGVSENNFRHIALIAIVNVLLNGPFAPRELLTDEESCIAYLSRVFGLPPDNLRLLYTAYEAIYCCDTDCNDDTLAAIRHSLLVDIEDVMYH